MDQVGISTFIYIRMLRFVKVSAHSAHHKKGGGNSKVEEK